MGFLTDQPRGLNQKHFCGIFAASKAARLVWTTFLDLKLALHYLIFRTNLIFSGICICIIIMSRDQFMV